MQKKVSRRCRCRFLSLVSLSLMPAGYAWSASPPAIATGGISIGLEPLSTVGSAPVDMIQPPDSTNRFFVANQGGQVRIVQNGALLGTPFLNLSTAVALNT